MPDKPQNDYSQYYYGRYKKLFRSGYLEKIDNNKFSTKGDVEDSSFNESNEESTHKIIDMRQKKGGKYEISKKSGGKKFLLTFCIILMCISLLFLSVDIFSAKGIVGELKSVFNINDDGCTNYYAISMGTFNNVDEARQLSSAMRGRGGAGYIVHSGSYNVLASCYLNYEDAKAVADANGANVYVLRVFEKNRKSFPAKLRDEYDKTVGYERMVYETLYSLSNRLDEGIITESDTVQGIKELQARLKTKTDNFLEQSSGYTDEFTIEYRVGIIACVASLENLTNLSLIRPNLLCDIRYTYLMVLNLAR